MRRLLAAIARERTVWTLWATEAGELLDDMADCGCMPNLEQAEEWTETVEHLRAQLVELQDMGFYHPPGKATGPDGRPVQ
jgi:hypothetical protein